MEAKESWIIADGNLKPAGTPIAGANSRGLMYGEGVFETLRIYQGRTLLLNNHLERLEQGLATLGIEAGNKLREQNIKKDILNLLKKNKLLDRDAVVRLQFWQDGSRGFLASSKTVARYMLTAAACSEYDEASTLVTVSVPRISTKALPATAKFTNNINYILAAREAQKKEADDGLMLTADRRVSETTIANIFWTKDNQIYTPSEQCDLLPGITRRILLNILNNHESLSVNEGAYSLDALYEADAVWICNSVREVMPVHTVDDYSFEVNNRVLEEMISRYTDFRDQHLKELTSK